MKKAKYVMSVLLVAGIVSLTQCAWAAVTLTFWNEWSGDPAAPAINKIVDKFMSENPDIKIKQRQIENEQFFTVMRTAFMGGKAPDIFQHEAHNNLWQFIRPGLVHDINDWFLEHKDRFVPGTETSIMYKGKYYGIPWAVDTNSQMYANGKILDKYGIEEPKTWSEFLAACQKLKDQGVTPIALGNKYGWPAGNLWFPALLARWVGSQKVWDLCARKPGHHWTDPDIVQAARFFQELNDRDFFSAGKASDDYAAAMGLFASGRTGFFHSASFLLAALKTSFPPDFDLRIMPFPLIEGAKAKPCEIHLAVLSGVSLSTNLEDLEPGLKFLEFLSRKEISGIWVESNQRPHSIEGAVNERTASKYLMEIMEEVIEGNCGTVPYLDHVMPKEMGEAGPIFTGATGVLTGELTAQTWMEWVETEAAKYGSVL